MRSAGRDFMNPILIRIPAFAMALGIFSTLGACNKPTSGSNTSEFREGNSGATSETIRKDTPIDSAKPDK